MDDDQPGSSSASAAAHINDNLVPLLQHLQKRLKFDFEKGTTFINQVAERFQQKDPHRYDCIINLLKQLDDGLLNIESAHWKMMKLLNRHDDLKEDFLFIFTTKGQDAMKMYLQIRTKIEDLDPELLDEYDILAFEQREEAKKGEINIEHFRDQLANLFDGNAELIETLNESLPDYLKLPNNENF